MSSFLHIHLFLLGLLQLSPCLLLWLPVAIDVHHRHSWVDSYLSIVIHTVTHSCQYGLPVHRRVRLPLIRLLWQPPLLPP